MRRTLRDNCSSMEETLSRASCCSNPEMPPSPSRPASRDKASPNVVREVCCNPPDCEDMALWPLSPSSQTDADSSKGSAGCGVSHSPIPMPLALSLCRSCPCRICPFSTAPASIPVRGGWWAFRGVVPKLSSPTMDLRPCSSRSPMSSVDSAMVCVIASLSSTFAPPAPPRSKVSKPTIPPKGELPELVNVNAAAVGDIPASCAVWPGMLRAL
mmetsp:Transcript_36032/g.90574  ORF Transcript_36032/g.90574 Transcript_36032/m.90574 type:complete len:213 (+) Transcript_36032:452-1090(+)